MLIISRTETEYNIKCDKCGEIIKRHKSNCKIYGREYWFNPPLECTCGNSCKVVFVEENNLIPYLESSSSSNNERYIEITSDNSSQKMKNHNSFLDLFKAKQFKEEIENYKIQIEKLKKENEHIKNESENIKIKLIEAEDRNVDLVSENNKLNSLFTDEHYRALGIQKYLKELDFKQSEVLLQISQNQNTANILQEKIDELNKEIIELDDEILYQSFGLYTPIYDLRTSKEFKDQLDLTRDLQKIMIKEKTAAICMNDWRVNDSLREGKKMINNKIKEIVRSFNTECESIMLKVKFNNYDSMKERIYKSYEKLNELNESLTVTISEEFLKSKYDELDLCYGYARKKQEEKEEAQMIREQLREEAKLAKEIEEKRREIEKEQQHYNNALKKINDQIEMERSDIRLQFLLDKKREIEENLIDLDKALKDVDYREANQRAGYVYIISNIGAFGENVYKIGMTRRLDPQERIDELGNASVPFKYDIHAMIFSDDAPKLENVLHRAFENKRINAMNNRKEFFRVSLSEIEEVVKANHDKTVEFIKVPPAQQYRESQKLSIDNKNK